MHCNHGTDAFSTLTRHKQRDSPRRVGILFDCNRIRLPHRQRVQDLTDVSICIAEHSLQDGTRDRDALPITRRDIRELSHTHEVIPSVRRTGQ